jgi:threonine/homoserine/homoserine lactone efflux protein
VGKAIGDILPLAFGVAISPVPIIAVVLMLGTPQARVNGLAFAVGWVVGLSAVGAIMLLIASGNAASSTGEPATWVDVLKLVFGVLFFLIAAKQWRSRPTTGEEAAMPKWMRAIDTFTAGKSLGAGLVLSGLNPKNLALTIAAAVAIAQTEISGASEAGVLAIFIFIGSLTILAPVALYFGLGPRAERLLDGVKKWMAAHNAAIMTVLLLVLGAKLIGDAIGGLSS